MDLNGNKSSDFFEHAMVTACMSLILNLAALPNTIQYNTIQYNTIQYNTIQ